MITLLASLLTSRLGGWLIGGLAVGAVLLLLKFERASKAKAQAAAATAKLAAEISQQQLLLYQEREEIQAQAAAERSKLNDLEKNNDLDGLSAIVNGTPGTPGVRKLPVAGHHSPRSPKAAAGGQGAPEDAAQYQGADGDRYR